MKKTVVEGSVGWCMANKNLEFDSYIVKWWGVGDLWGGLCYNGLFVDFLS